MLQIDCMFAHVRVFSTLAVHTCYRSTACLHTLHYTQQIQYAQQMLQGINGRMRGTHMLMNRRLSTEQPQNDLVYADGDGSPEEQERHSHSRKDGEKSKPIVKLFYRIILRANAV
jgi:hypothetical protein